MFCHSFKPLESCCMSAHWWQQADSRNSHAENKLSVIYIHTHEYTVYPYSLLEKKSCLYGWKCQPQRWSVIFLFVCQTFPLYSLYRYYEAFLSLWDYCVSPVTIAKVGIVCLFFNLVTIGTCNVQPRTSHTIVVCRSRLNLDVAENKKFTEMPLFFFLSTFGLYVAFFWKWLDRKTEKKGGWDVAKGHKPGLKPRPAELRTCSLCTWSAL